MASFRAKLLQPRSLNVLFLGGLIAAVWITYRPSLDHVPRADQWAYLIDTLHCHTLGELWSQSYSYNRVRAVGPGDADLFRPILFALLVLEKHFFGNDFMPSQAIGLLLHTVVVLLLFRLLQRMHQHTLREHPAAQSLPWALVPHAVTVFFAINFAGMELVVWAHLHGYLLFLVFILGSLLLLADLVLRDEMTPRRLRWTMAGCWLLALLSAFTYELGQFFAVILGVVVGLHFYKRPAAKPAARGALLLACAFAAILPIYQAVNKWDRAVHQGQFAEEYLPQLIRERAVSLDTLEHAGRFVTFAVVQPFFPSVTGCWYQGERIHIQEPVFGWPKYVQLNAKLLLSYAVFVLFCGFCVVAARRWQQGQGRRLGPLIAVPWTLLALYAAITVLGRMNLRPSRFVLASNAYYTYIALLFFVIGACALWQALAGMPTTRRRNQFAVVLSAGLVFLGAYSSGRIRHVATRITERYAGFHQAVRDLEAFIADHGHEPGFRLAFDMRPDDPFPITHSIPFPLTLYSRWIDNYDPKYVVSFPEGCFTVVAADAWRRQHPGGPQLFPDLVRVGTDYNLWRWNGKYYGSLFWDDVFRPDLKDHAYLIAGDSIQEVLDLVPVRHEEFMEDMRTGWCIPPSMGMKVIDDNYAGFELVEAGAFFYAAPAAEGPFRPDRFNARRYSQAFVAEDVATLRRYVDECAVAAARDSASAPR